MTFLKELSFTSTLFLSKCLSPVDVFNKIAGNKIAITTKMKYIHFFLIKYEGLKTFLGQGKIQGDFLGKIVLTIKRVEIIN